MNWSKIIDSLLGQGPLVMMALIAVYVLHNEKKELAKKLGDKETERLQAAADHQDEMLAEREKRVDEQKAATQALRESNQALKGAADALLSTRRSRSQNPTSGND